jgi:hypothetical protein
MKKTSHHHEILLFSGTNLASKQFTNLEQNNNARHYTAIEELEKACWDGTLYEMFPEILGNTCPKCKSFLWHVLPGKNFLYINIGPNPVAAEHDTSIDPYFFMMYACES